MTWKEVVMARLRHYPCIYLEEIKRNHEEAQDRAVSALAKTKKIISRI
jgi:hypothetical protein